MSPADAPTVVLPARPVVAAVAAVVLGAGETGRCSRRYAPGVARTPRYRSSRGMTDLSIAQIATLLSARPVGDHPPAGLAEAVDTAAAATAGKPSGNPIK